MNPLLGELLGPMQYYWATAQAEYSTDVICKTRQDLAELMPRLVEHSLLSLGANKVMNFLGRDLRGPVARLWCANCGCRRERPTRTVILPDGRAKVVIDE